jgi:AsmA protein
LLRDAIGFDRIAGRGRLRATLEGAGASQAAVMRSLGGSASFVFNDGQWKGVNLAQIARTIQTLGRAGGTGGSGTDFAELSATFRVANGAAVTQDLRLLNPFVRLEGQGIIDIGRQSIDMRIAPRAVSSIQGQGGRADIAGIGVPFRVSGPWSHVTFSLAVGDLVQRELQQRMGSALGGDNPLGSLGAAITGRRPAQDAQKDQQSPPRQPSITDLFKRN